jgi:hypothetical protein
MKLIMHIYQNRLMYVNGDIETTLDEIGSYASNYKIVETDNIGLRFQNFITKTSMKYLKHNLSNIISKLPTTNSAYIVDNSSLLGTVIINHVRWFEYCIYNCRHQTDIDMRKNTIVHNSYIDFDLMKEIEKYIRAM